MIYELTLKFFRVVFSFFEIPHTHNSSVNVFLLHVVNLADLVFVVFSWSTEEGEEKYLKNVTGDS